MATIVNNPGSGGTDRVVSTDSGAGWAVAVIILLAVILIGGYFWMSRAPARAPAENGAANINVNVPVPGTSGDTGGGAGGGAQGGAGGTVPAGSAGGSATE